MSNPIDNDNPLDLNKLVVDNLGIIAGRALYWWKRLPLSVKQGYDPEDMISEVALHVIKAAGHYRSDKALPSTFVYHVADNKAQLIMSHYRTAKRCADLVPLDKLLNLSAADSTTRLRESRSAVERVIQYASPGLRNWLAGWLSQSNVHRKPAPAVEQELLNLSHQHGVRFRDFQLVFQQLVG